MSADASVIIPDSDDEGADADAAQDEGSIRTRLDAAGAPSELPTELASTWLAVAEAPPPQLIVRQYRQTDGTVKNGVFLAEGKTTKC